MKRILFSLLFLSSLSAFAAPKTYQVTGQVVEATKDLIVVQKGKEKWELVRDGSTKVTGDLKVGSKVTIEYRMTSTDVEVKADKKSTPKSRR